MKVFFAIKWQINRTVQLSFFLSKTIVTNHYCSFFFSFASLDDSNNLLYKFDQIDQLSLPEDEPVVSIDLFDHFLQRW